MKLSEIKDGMKVFTVRVNMLNEVFNDRHHVLFGIMKGGEFYPSAHSFHENRKNVIFFSHILLPEKYYDDDKDEMIFGFVLNGEFTAVNKENAYYYPIKENLELSQCHSLK